MKLPADEYARRGGDIRYSTELPLDETFDVVIGQRVCRPDSTRAWQGLKGRTLLVYEIDDDLFHVDPASTAAYKFYARPEVQDNIRANVAIADVVTVSTEPLGELLRPINPNVVVVPNRIPGWLLEHDRPRNTHLTLGWAGSGTHEIDWADPGPQVSRFLWRNNDIRAHIIGSPFTAMRNWPLDRVRFTHWLNSIDDYYRTLDFDIGVIPLRPHVFNRSKSALKALEQGALGIPVVASAVGPYESFVRHGVSGYLVRTDHEWGRYLRLLADDADARTELGQAGRVIAARHTVEGNLRSWLDAWGVPAPELEEAA
jgi:hypothetical protein